MIAIYAWKPADGLTLEPNALLAAKEQVRSLALTAGPGAGKTEMLAQRADFLLRTGTCRYPKRILAISFKVDASSNLKERVKRRCGSELATRFDSYTFHAFAKRIIDRFRPILVGQDALNANYKIVERKARPSPQEIEFGDLVPLAIKILQTSAVARNAIRQTYSDVFLDEFQDCTNLQYELLRLAFQGTIIRLTAVGDTKQKIMGWAGALEGIFQDFVADFAATPLNMYRNFRSKPRLLCLQNEIIRKLDPSSVMPDEQLVGDEGEVFAWRFEDVRKDFDRLVKQQRKEIAIAGLIDESFSGYWEFVRAFLKQVSIETLVSLSPDYESHGRLKEVVRDTKARIEELLKLEPDLPKALERFSDDQAVRILTIHKSKGLEFDSVIIMAVENETFFFKNESEQKENLCAYFVGVSRAKKRLILTHADQRDRPAGYTRRWDVQRSAQTEYFGYVTPFVE